MNGNSFAHTKKILLAPLDWGLGHATRCIPVIKGLIDQGNEVVIAAEGPSATLLQLEFPSLRFLSLAGYRVEYGRSRLELQALEGDILPSQNEISGLVPPLYFSFQLFGDQYQLLSSSESGNCGEMDEHVSRQFFVLSEA